MIRMLGSLLFAGAGIVSAVAAESYRVPTRKYCFSAGWEFIYTPPRVIAEHIDAYRGGPLSGANFYLFGKLKDGREVSSQTVTIDPRWTREAFAEDEAALKKLSQVPEFSKSMIHVLRAPDSKRMTWTDDERWNVYSNNVRIAAAIAKATGMIGVSGDNEEYKARQFHHLPSDPPYDECAKLARQRGREVFGAVFAEFPDAKMHFSRLYSNEIWNYSFGARDARRLAKERGDLWIHYLDGALDVIPPEAVLYEGAESAYRHDPKYHDSLDSAARIKTDLVWAVAPENRLKYRAQVRVAMPLYVDRYETPEKIAQVGQTLQKRYVVKPVEGSYMAALERDFTDKLAASDDYVWVYTEQLPLIRWERPKGYHAWSKHCGQYVFGDYLPGLNDLFACVQHPEEWSVRKIAQLKAEGKLKNLVPDSMPDGELPPELKVWQDNAQPGTYGVKDGLVWLKGVGWGSLYCSTEDVREGDYYAFSFEVKGRVGSAQVNLHRKGTASDTPFPVPRSFHVEGDDETVWRTCSGVVRVPADLESLMLSFNTLHLRPDETVYYRNLVFARVASYNGRAFAPAPNTDAALFDPDDQLRFISEFHPGVYERLVADGFNGLMKNWEIPSLAVLTNSAANAYYRKCAENMTNVLAKCERDHINFIENMPEWGHSNAFRDQYPIIARDGSKLRRIDASDTNLLAEVSRLASVKAADAATFSRAYVGLRVAGETRDLTRPSFSPAQRARYFQESGRQVPPEVDGRLPPCWKEIAGFPKNRVLDEDYPLLHYYRWFWDRGDGWNTFKSTINDAFAKAFGKRPYISIYGPPLRSLQRWASGGNVTHRI